MELLFDHERDRCQVVRVGWLQGKRARVYGVLIHVDIIDGKIWIQYDGTEVAGSVAVPSASHINY